LTIPNGGWVLAWAYGSTANQTGMTIYSGLDADAFAEPATPNYADKELAIELATPFQRTVSAGCAPGCAPPPPPGTTGSTGSTGSTGATGTTGSKTTSTTFTHCSFTRTPPVKWVHGRVPLEVTTAVATGLSGQVVTAAGKVVASATPTTPGQLTLVVNTRLLPTNRKAALQALVIVNSARACTLPTTLKVDNTPPKLLKLKVKQAAGGRVLVVRSSENAQLSIKVGKRTLSTTHVKGRVTTTVTLPHSFHAGTLVLVDRAGNRTSRKLG